MSRLSKEQLYYWEMHRCFYCGKHSGSPKALPMIHKFGGYLCIPCYTKLFGKSPE